MADQESYLVSKYYHSTKNQSPAVSSHWEKFTRYQSIKLSKNQKILSIKGAGFGDYRNRNLIKMLKNLPTYMYLRRHLFPTCDPSILAHGLTNCKKTNQIMTYDLTRMILSLSFILKYIPSLDNKRVVIIGDGYGRMGTLIKATFPKAKIFYINLGRTLLFDLVYSKKNFPEFAHSVLINLNSAVGDFNYIEAEEISQHKIVGDVFINIASMQEMNYETIGEYFNIIKSQNKGTLFYCCNRESKVLPDGNIIDFDKYPWDDLKVEIQERCPWYQEFPSNRPPFKGKFDGPILHSISLVD